jgi:hypothetical protein
MSRRSVEEAEFNVSILNFHIGQTTSNNSMNGTELLYIVLQLAVTFLSRIGIDPSLLKACLLANKSWFHSCQPLADTLVHL